MYGDAHNAKSLSIIVLLFAAIDSPDAHPDMYGRKLRI